MPAQWGLKHARYHSLRGVGRDLRLLGYEVSARRNRNWTVSRRDRFEIWEFAADYCRVRKSLLESHLPSLGEKMIPAGCMVSTDPTSKSFLDALSWSMDHRAEFAHRSVFHFSCCRRCHNRFEETHAFPYLTERQRKQLDSEHQGPHATRDHVRREMRMFAEAGVPERFLAHLSGDHRKMERDGRIK